MNAKLVVVGGDAESQEVNLKLPTVIGRGKESGLIVPHALVSRRHCEIFEREGLLIVRDLNSLNGTYINNYRIQGEQPLYPGELLTLGNVTFRAIYGEASDVGGQMSMTPGTAAGPLNATVRVDEPARAPEIQKTTPAPIPATPRAAMDSPSADGEKRTGPKSNNSKEPQKVRSQPKPVEKLEAVAAAQPADDQIDFSELPRLADVERSISVSGLDFLPKSDVPEISHINITPVGDAADTPASFIDPAVFLHVTNEPAKSNEVDPQSLESFLKKVK